MPRIANRILDCVVYLYPTVHAARTGERAGGTGFVVGVPFSIDPPLTMGRRWHFYAVTNAHVIRKAGSPVIRVNTTDDFDFINGDASAWTCHPDSDDIAVRAIEPSDQHVISYVPTDIFATQQVIDDYSLGPGDDIFMVGRFITHDGKQRNRPVVRFGNVAMMPPEKIMNDDDLELESFLVEMRSISGSSGSPVFIHIPPFADRPEYARLRSQTLEATSYGPWLLGIDWGTSPRLRACARERPQNVDQRWICCSV